MALYKHKIDFDPTDAASHDRIGSFLVGLEGEVVTTSDLGGGKRGLDVVIGSIMLGSDSGVFLEDTAMSPGDKGQSVLLVRQDTLAISTSDDGDYGNFKGTDKGELYVHDSDALAMLTTIETDLDAVNASLVAINSDTTAILADTATIDSNLATIIKGIADDVTSTENSLLVGAVAHSPASALSAVSAAGDKVNLASDLNRRMFVNNAMAVAWKVTAATVGASAARLDATPLASRCLVTVQNMSPKALELGSDNTVTFGTGINIPKYSERDLPYTAALQLWAIGEQAGQDVRLLEAG